MIDAPAHLPGSAELLDTATDLLRSVAVHRQGTLSPSVYETARLVSAAPWLPGHEARLEFLVEQQRRDGGWGVPGPYGLVPTLSATEALLATQLGRPTPTGATRRRATRELATAIDLAVTRGVAHSRRLLGSLGAADLPDTPAIEIIVPYLVGLIDGHGVTLPLPSGVDDGLLIAVRGLLGSPAIPTKMLHSLEVTHELAAGARLGARRVAGPIGASPASTAAWLGGRPSGPSEPYAYLRPLAAAGPVPSVTPITAFERAWVVNSLAQAEVPAIAPAGLVREMLASVGPHGVAGGAGLPADADTTSFTLAALAHLGQPTRVAVLREFDQGTHFCTWAGERTPSPTTNAHVLAALAVAGSSSAWRDDAMRRAAAWLIERQDGDGAWSDKWHASPYYATMCAVMALRDAQTAGTGTSGAAKAVELSVGWVLSTQRRDGSWGRFAGTAEETAYALQILLYEALAPDPGARRAAQRGQRFLNAARDEEPMPLWHDKDLYAPYYVVRAAVIAALHLAQTRLGPVRPARTDAEVGARAVPEIPRSRQRR